MTEKKITRRERRAAETKQRILDAATTVFAEKGFHRSTTKEIAEVADVAEGTIYNYFANKDDILVEMIAQLADLQTRGRLYADSLDRDLRQFWTDHLVQRLTEVESSLDLLQASLPEIIHSPELRKRYDEQVMRPAIEMLEQHLQARVERGDLPAPLSIPFTIRAIVGLLWGLQFLLLLDDEVVRDVWDHPHEMAELLLSVIFDGLNPKG